MSRPAPATGHHPRRRLPGSRHAAAALALLVACGCGSPVNEAAQTTPGFGDPSATTAPSDADLAALTRLYALSQDRDAARAAIQAEPGLFAEFDLGRPVGPYLTFLSAEALLVAGEADRARAAHRRLAEWGVATAEQGAGSALATVGLWRWASALGAVPAPDPDEARALVDATRKVLDSRYSRLLFQFGVLESLPQIEEQILRHVALLAWDHVSREAGQGFFVDFLSVARTPDLAPAEQRVFDEIVRAEWASAERLEMLRANRLVALGLFDEAVDVLERLRVSGDHHNRMNASLRLAEVLFDLRRREDRQRAVEMLGTVAEDARDPYQRQEALHLRALFHGRTGDQGFVDDLERLIEEYPTGPRTDDALYRLARYYQLRYEGPEASEDLLTDAFAYYDRLRAFAGENDFQDSAYYQPALALFARGRPDDLRDAERLLADYAERAPDGALQVHARFWRGRMLERLDRREEAAALFDSIAAGWPFDYYGLRARMHRSAGRDAARQLWPDASVRDDIAKDHEPLAPPELPARSPFHVRLRAAVASGLYARALDDRRRLSGLFPDRRLPTMPLADLDASGRVPPVVVLLALRQEAIAAQEQNESVGNHLEIQVAVGQQAGDWPLATSMAVGTYDRYHGAEAIQRTPGFLAAAYPPVYRERVERVAASSRVPAELLYAVMRRESLFEPAAHSAVGALGLFQFFPPMFARLDERWQLLGASGATSPAEYLLDPDRNMALGGRWFGEILMPDWVCRVRTGRPCRRDAAGRPIEALTAPDAWFDEDLPPAERIVPLLSVMEHSAGLTPVNTWRDHWRAVRLDHDVEYMIETAGSLETRLLTRGVLTDAAIVRAIGLFTE